jgi:hypothetical protein
MCMTRAAGGQSASAAPTTQAVANSESSGRTGSMATGATSAPETIVTITSAVTLGLVSSKSAESCAREPGRASTPELCIGKTPVSGGGLIIVVCGRLRILRQPEYFVNP